LRVYESPPEGIERKDGHPARIKEEREGDGRSESKFPSYGWTVSE